MRIVFFRVSARARGNLGKISQEGVMVIFCQATPHVQ